MKVIGFSGCIVSHLALLFASSAHAERPYCTRVYQLAYTGGASAGDRRGAFEQLFDFITADLQHGKLPLILSRLDEHHGIFYFEKPCEGGAAILDGMLARYQDQLGAFAAMPDEAYDPFDLHCGFEDDVDGCGWSTTWRP